jgi:hypothetical protein
MGDLENYSIETDQSVLLSFRDGRKVRVRPDRLSRYLGTKDLVKVRRAMRLRRDFLRLHMPKTAVVLLAAGLMAALLVSARTVAWILETDTGNPGHNAVVRSQTESRPQADPAPTAPGATPKLAARPHRQAQPTTALASAHLQLPAANLPVTLTAVSPAPLATPAAGPSPAPSATPQPDTNQPAGQPAPGQTAPSPTPAPDQGQVLGTSTGPQ